MAWSLNGAPTSCPDPEDFEYLRIPEHGAFMNGKPIRQGWPGGVLKFPPLPSAGMNELYAKYAANKNAITSGNLPLPSGYGWKAVSAYWHEPAPTGWEGPIAHGVTMQVSHIGEY
jgi:hypothetical protein